MTADVHTHDTATLGRRLEGTGWGLVLFVTGLLWLIPREVVPEGTWLMAIGAILIGLNVARLLSHLPVSIFTLSIGFVALLGGFAAWMNLDLPVFALFLILIGIALTMRAWLGRQT